ncbi:uncharacterized protein LOC142620724 [Castanea sativa]|uniref:uncharacterized protein LOC142620724 n=1 Tax=Castanea sativa TaxID=21020 RepID=UPI003F64C93B
MGLGSSRMESGSPLDPDSNYTSIRVDDSDEEISDRLVCPICFTNEKDLIFGCGHLGFQETRKLNEGELFLTLVDGSRIPIVAVGVVNIWFDSRVLILQDCLYILNVRRNLIFAIYLGKHGYCVILKDNIVIKKDKMFICSSNIVDGFYILTPDKHELYNSELDSSSHVKSLKRKFPYTNDAYL